MLNIKSRANQAKNNEIISTHPINESLFLRFIFIDLNESEKTHSK